MASEMADGQTVSKMVGQKAGHGENHQICAVRTFARPFIGQFGTLPKNGRRPFLRHFWFWAGFPFCSRPAKSQLHPGRTVHTIGSKISARPFHGASHPLFHFFFVIFSIIINIMTMIIMIIIVIITTRFIIFILFFICVVLSCWSYLAMLATAPSGNDSLSSWDQKQTPSQEKLKQNKQKATQQNNNHINKGNTSRNRGGRVIHSALSGTIPNFQWLCSLLFARLLMMLP